MFGRTDLLSYHATHVRRSAFRAISAFLVLFGALAAIAGCSSNAPPTAPIVRASPSPTSPNNTPGVGPTETAQPVSTASDPTAPITLTVWLPPDMALSAQSNGQALQKVGESFQAENPNTYIEIVPKAAYGTGGLVNALLATRPVVPSRLPDIIALDTAELDVLAAQGMLAPLDDLVPVTTWQDLYPFTVTALSMVDASLGSAMTSSNGKRFAIPFQVDIDFVAYNTSNIQIAPRTWAAMGESGAKYVFPASQGNGDAADAFLLQYVAQGGQLLSEGGRPYLDSAIMANVLALYRQAVDAGVVPISVRNLQTRDDCWDAYMQDKATMTQVSSWVYQREKGTLRRTRYAAVPTADGVLSTLARSRSWAIVADDPVRQKLASRYILTALSPQALSSWCVQSFHLPAQRAALALVVEDELYRAFLEEQLQHAHPYPNLSYYARLQTIIISAIEDVLDGVSTPERAAVTAAAMAARLR